MVLLYFQRYMHGDGGGGDGASGFDGQTFLKFDLMSLHLH